MASNKLCATILVLCLLAYSTFTHACSTCGIPSPVEGIPSPVEGIPSPIEGTPYPPPVEGIPSPVEGIPYPPPIEGTPYPPPVEGTPYPPPIEGTPYPPPVEGIPYPPPVEGIPYPPFEEKCPKDTMKLGACANILGFGNVVGTPPSSECCAMLSGLMDMEAALCLCTAMKAKVLGIYMNIPVTLSMILSACQKKVPPGFQCA